ncbi:MAG: DUF1998 domain-containing protein [Caldilineaceae bacterium SB0666_bin_21]|nr:DUF1998 domain-containing protein [Caldilineaceae bacterium SB0666_bin_21]
MYKKSTQCASNGDPPLARRQILLHEEITEALTLDFGPWNLALQRDGGCLNTWLAGLPRAVSETLDINNGEVAAAAYPFRVGQGILLYDTAPGGAGHVMELLSAHVLKGVLERLRQRLYVNEEHHRTCGSGCLDCVLDYGAVQAFTPIDRQRGLQRLDAMLAGQAPPEVEVDSPVEDQQTSIVLDNEERRARAKQRREP